MTERVVVTILQISREGGDPPVDHSTGNGERFYLEGNPDFPTTIKALKDAGFKQIFHDDEAFK